jgi:prepilin-type N-terminal cleavage/methylation domain-containing protein
MWRKLPNERQAGFTVPEVLVTLIILVAILVVAAQVLFQTRAASERQRAQVEARQAARTAVEYVHYMLRGATDMNGQIETAPSPMALLTWVRFRNNNNLTQVSYDNLTASQAAAGYGDEGTDIISFARAEDSRLVRIADWNGSDSQSAPLAFAFTDKCPDSAANLEAFQRMTGAYPVPPSNRLQSEPFVVFDPKGNMRFLEITDYKEGDNRNNCADGVINVIANPGRSSVNPPGGHNPLSCSDSNTPCYGALGVRLFSLRVRNGWLEQRRGVFDPLNRNEGFVPVVPNVEDFQVVYFLRNGRVRNGPGDPNSGTVPPATPPAWESGFDPNADHVTNVIALRITITARSTSELPRVQEAIARFLRPAAENHRQAAVRDRFYRFQASAMTLLRARTPQV